MSEKREETISLIQRAKVSLNKYGVFLLDQHVYGTAETYEEWRGGARDRPGHPVYLAVWEILAIFGPHIRSSARLPINAIKFEREESREEMAVRNISHRSEQFEASLKKLMRAIGIYGGYKAPEEFADIVTDYVSRTPPAKPSIPGHWWLDYEVVRVVQTDDGLLAVRTRNNRLKPVDDYTGTWQGPAIMDRRVAPDTQDIPF